MQRTYYRPSCSVNSVINFVTGRWKHLTSFVKTRDWLTGYDVRGRVLLAGRPAVALKAEKPGPVHSEDDIPGWSEVVHLLSRLYTQTSFLAIHCPYYRHKCRVHKGGTESVLKKSAEFISCFWWNNTGARLVWLMLYSREVGTSALWRNLKNSSHASDEKTLYTRAGWCDWCLTAEKSVPVRSDEECTFHEESPLVNSAQNYVDWGFRDF